MDAAVALLLLRNPALCVDRVLDAREPAPCASRPPTRMPPNEKRNTIIKLGMLAACGFTCTHLREAGFPRKMCVLMHKVQGAHPRLFRPPSPYTLAPYGSVQYATTTSPHVTCPQGTAAYA